MLRPTSLQSVLGLRFIVAAALPLLLFGWFTYRYLAERQMDEARADLEHHALSIRDEIGNFAGHLRSNLLLIRDSVDNLAGKGPAEVDALLQFAANQSEYFEAIYLLDDNLRVRHLGLPANMVARRHDFLNFDFSGLELLSKGQRPRTMTFADGRDVIAISDSFISVATGKPSIMVLLEMPRGFLLGTVNLDQFGGYLQRRVRQSKAMAFAVVDHHGTLVAHTNQQLAIERGSFLNHAEVRDVLATGRKIASKLHEDGSLLESVSLVPQTGWVVHAAMPREFILHDANRLRTVLLSSMVVVVVLSGGLAFWQARRVIRPLLRLRDGTRNVAQGDYRGLGRLTRDGYVELDDLTANFLEMGAAVMERETFLRASEERYRSLLAGMGEGLLIIAGNGKVIDCNEAAERIFSLTRGEIVGRDLPSGSWRVIHEDGTVVAPEEYPFSVTLQTGTDINNQLIGLCAADGREIWLQMNCRPQWSLHGEINAAIVTFADVTRLKVAEASLRIGKLRYQELFQQFSALLEGITDRIYLLTPDMQIAWSNAGNVNPQIPGNGSPECDCCFTEHAGRGVPCGECPVLRCFASGRRETGEIVDRRGLTWNLRAFPVKSEETVTQVVLIAEDITEVLESERQRSRASRLAALGELAAGVAHEINNPISGVINYAQLILNRAGADSREHDLARRIIKEGDRIATIVRELLTFARDGSSETQVVSIREALAEALSLCESQIRKEIIDLRIDLPGDLPRVESRNHQLQQLFLNLISNSRHALGEKYPGASADKILSISGRAIELNGRPGVRLKIKDHGIGIPPPLLDRVMNPFVTTKPAGVGTGLGLSISFDIVKKHGGTLAIASEQGAWTEVTVDLPASAATLADGTAA